MYKATISPYELTLYDNTLEGIKHKAYTSVKDMRDVFIDIIYEDINEGYIDSDNIFIDEKGNVEFV